MSHRTDTLALQGSIYDTAERLQAAIEAETMARRALKDAEAALSAAEAELIADAVIAAKADGAGPLAGIAQSSGAFSKAVDALVARAHRDGLRVLVDETRRKRQSADEAETERQQLAARFASLRAVADLQVSINDLQVSINNQQPRRRGRNV